MPGCTAVTGQRAPGKATLGPDPTFAHTWNVPAVASLLLIKNNQFPPVLVTDGALRHHKKEKTSKQALHRRGHVRLHRAARGCSKPPVGRQRHADSDTGTPCTAGRVVTVSGAGQCQLLAAWWEAGALQDHSGGRSRKHPSGRTRQAARPSGPTREGSPRETPGSVPAGRPALCVGWGRAAAQCPAAGHRSGHQHTDSHMPQVTCAHSNVGTVPDAVRAPHAHRKTTMEKVGNGECWRGRGEAGSLGTAGGDVGWRSCCGDSVEVPQNKT